MYTAMEIAQYIINKCTLEKCPISNLQLQKILYYVQKTFLQNDMLAFSDEIEAWQFGPVVREVYNKCCGFGSAKIRLTYNIDLMRDFKRIINPIVEEKRVMSPWDLVNDTHRPDKAWAAIYRGGLGNHQVIPVNLIKEIG